MSTTKCLWEVFCTCDPRFKFFTVRLKIGSRNVGTINGRAREIAGLMERGSSGSCAPKRQEGKGIRQES